MIARSLIHITSLIRIGRSLPVVMPPMGSAIDNRYAELREIGSEKWLNPNHGAVTVVRAAVGDVLETSCLGGCVPPMHNYGV